MIDFNRSTITSLEKDYVQDALDNCYLSGDQKYTDLCTKWFNRKGFKNFLLTTSGSSALELAAMLTDIKPGDEFITPSFTFSSTANAFMLRGAKPVFAEIDPQTMNIDPIDIEKRITTKTKAIVPIDYAGVPCDIDTINQIAKKHHLLVVQDAAQAVGSKYKDEPCGLRADFACFSFHETKNYTMGEGGAIFIKDDHLMEKAEIIREKGTNRKQYLNGQVDKYTWHMVGASILPSDTLSAILYGQLRRFDEILEKRLYIWRQYYNFFANLEQQGQLKRPFIPKYAKHNGHIFYLILNDNETRDNLLNYLRAHGIGATFHYLPLHSAPLGQKYGYRTKDLPITEEYAKRLIRLPIYHAMTEEDIIEVCNQVNNFFSIK